MALALPTVRVSRWVPPAPGSDDRLADGADLVERRQKVAAIGFDKCLGVHLFDVDARRKSLLVAGDDDGADIGVGFEGLQRAIEFADEKRVEGV